MKNAEAIQRDVVDELAWEPKVDSSAIGVTVSDGIVTITGQVPTYAEKIDAEQAALRVFGVKAVVDQLDVQLKKPFLRDDAAIADAAVTALQWNVNVPSNKVNVVVTRGIVKLEGEVSWNYQKEAAQNAVRYLAGVRGVLNLIRIKPSPNARALKDKIEAAFKRSAEVDANNVRVVTTGGKITLSGKVRSWAERQEAESVAWSSPGAMDVANQLEIELPVPAM